MPEQTEGELQKLAMPALRHAELVALARTHSPSKVLELATAGNWPMRQAKAARALAILRRDFGDNALESFLTTMEHARRVSTRTGHAQEVRRMSANTVTELVPNLGNQLKIFIVRGIVAETKRCSTDSSQNGTCAFGQAATTAIRIRSSSTR